MNRKVKRLFTLLLAAILTISLAGCGEIKKAESTVNNMFTAFKNLDFEEAQKYIDVEELTDGDSEDSLTGNSEIFMKNLFDKLNYEIIASEKIDKNTVNVTTKITAVDMKPVLGEFMVAAMQYAFANAFADPQPTEEETDQKMEELLIESLSKPDLATVTNEVVIKVSKGDNGWEIVSDDALIDALLGGLVKAAEELENSFN